MPNEKTHRIPMPFEYMQTLVRTFLGRPCSCDSEDTKRCPTDIDGQQMWHTWRRYGSKNQLCEHDACCFVKRDRLCLNILDIHKSAFLQEMESAGWTVYVNDLRYANMTRYDVMAMDATREQLTVLKRWIEKTVNAFPKANR